MVAAIIIASVLVVLILITYLVANVFAKVVVFPNTHDYEYSRNAVLRHNCPIDPLTTLENHKVEEFTYRSELGYDLYGRIIRADEGRSFPDGRQRAVILSHGWTSNHITMLTYGKIYQELGFNIVAFDHRYHGKSAKGPGIWCTMGLMEHKDLIGLANYVRQFFPEDTVWGIQGESMGSATAMMAAPHLPWLSFLVEDCGYSSMRKEMSSTLKSKHLPEFPILNIGGLILKSRYKLDMNKVSPETTVSEIDIPMLFCQGDHDTFVPTRMIYDVYGAKKDKKEIHLFKDSEHAESIWDHTDEYRQVVREFLEKYKII